MSDEILGPHENPYQPLSTFPEVQMKIKDLLDKPPATITDTELFEGIADTHTTIAALSVHVGVETIDGGLATINDLNCIDYESSSGIIGTVLILDQNIQRAYIDMESEFGYTFHFMRDGSGEVSSSRTLDEEDEVIYYPFSPNAHERRRIVEELMKCITLKNTTDLS